MPAIILRTGPAPVDELNPYHRNPRRGNVDAIAESLQKQGQYRAIVVNVGTKTGRPNEVLAGNHTLKAARELGWEALEAHWVDLTDEEAQRVVLADNRTADLGTYDADTLIALLEDMGDDNLEGTGYNSDDLLELLAENRGAPGAADFLEAGEDEYAEQYGVTVLCADEGEQELVFEKLKGMGYSVRVVTV